jgi:hypothetical protein
MAPIWIIKFNFEQKLYRYCEKICNHEIDLNSYQLIDFLNYYYFILQHMNLDYAVLEKVVKTIAFINHAVMIKY